MKRPVNGFSLRLNSARVFVIALVLAVGVAVFVSFAERSYGQGTLQPVHITFDGAPPQPPGSVYSIQQYYESGISFTPLGSSFGRAGGGIPQLPENGTAYLQAALTQSLMFGFTNGDVFNLDSVDLAEYSTVVPDAVSVDFVGWRHDGTVVGVRLTTDGVIDGTGPLADFQTFTFGKEFTDLDRVAIPTYGWSLDNLMVSRHVPEPATCGLLLLGGLAFLARRRFKSHWRN